MSVSALMYHDVIGADGVRGGFEGPGPAVYAVGEDDLERQLDGIEAALGTPPSRAEEGPPRDGAWMLTFDDGGSSAAAVGDELQGRGWPGHFFVATDMLGQPGFLDRDGVRRLAAQGHVVGSHSCSHPARMADLAPPRLREEWSRSVTLLTDALGAPVVTASVPGGHYSDDVGRAAAESGIATLFTSRPVRSVGRVDGCALVGRFAVRASTPTAAVVAAASGRAGPWLRQRAGWEARGLAKRAAGSRYERVRSVLLSRR